jgi:hypothetical protein
MFDAAFNGAMVVMKPILLVGGFVLLARFIAMVIKMRRG